jgi:hypothetical protein
MLSRDELPPNSHCLRHATPKQTATPVPTGAFLLKAAETELSFGWLEYFAEYLSYEERLKKVCFTQSVKPNASGRVLSVDVDAARTRLAAIPTLSGIRMLWTPIHNDPDQADDPCHASAVGLAALTASLQQAAAEQLALAVTKIHEWRELHKQGLVPKTWR